MRKLLFAFAVCVIPALVSAQAKLTLDKKVFAPGESISVNFTALPTYPTTAWVGIVPSNTPHVSEAENDKVDLAYQHLNGKTSGTLTFTAPSKPGSYDFRMNDSDADGKEVASVTFTVAAKPEEENKPALTLEKTSFFPGDEIKVQFTAPAGYPGTAWVGIVPSSVRHGSEAENDAKDLTYQHLNQRRKGTLTFQAPAQLGSYDLRMNDSDDGGREVASVTFAVVNRGR